MTDISYAAQDVVCCSLEPWDDIWRRNQHLATELLALRPTMRLLFAESPVDVTWSLLHHRRLPALRPVRPIGTSGRLWAVTPRKWLPRRISPGVDRRLGRQVLAAARRLGLRRPVLWINDSTYAGLGTLMGWPTVYDVTDDWLLAYDTGREGRRQQDNDRLLVARADEVVVCSPALAKSRGGTRPVHVIPNGVDVEHLRHPQPRPPDLPTGRTVLYQGSINEGRLDVDLCVTLAQAVAGRATVVLLGPSDLDAATHGRLRAAGVVLLGARPYRDLPAYLQHADVLVVPHRITPFTESLDPIKARELVTVARPTVSTPVAGFRELGPPIMAVAADRFAEAVVALLDQPPAPPGPGPLTSSPPTWTDRAREFLAVLDAAADGSAAGLPRA